MFIFMAQSLYLQVKKSARRTMATLDAGGASVQLTHRSGNATQLLLSVMDEQYSWAQIPF